MDFPGSVVTPTHIHTLSFPEAGLFGLKLNLVNTGITPQSVTWPSANLAIYVPMRLSYPYSVNRVFWVNGSAGGGNVDFGIYTLGGTKIYSTGSTAQSGTDVIQYVTPSSTFTLAPGRYLFALSSSATTNAVYALPVSAYPETGRLQGFFQQASSVPLPATASFAAITGSNLYPPYCGVTRTTTGF